MAESAKKNIFNLLVSLLLLCGSRAEVEFVSVRNDSRSDPFYDNQPFSHPHSAFSNLTVYLSFLDDVYDYLYTSSNVSEKCRKESSELLRRANDGDVNALKILDSTGKPSSGILEGGIYFIGFYSECVNSVINISTQEAIQAHYCVINLNFEASTHQENIPQVSWLVLTQSQKPPTIAVCIPSSCSETDLNFSMSSSLKHNFETVEGEVSVCHRDPSGFSNDIGALCITCFLVIVLFIEIVATVADVIQDNNNYITHLNSDVADNAKSVSREALCEISEQKLPKRSILLECLLAFSLKRNLKKLFVVESGNGNVQSVHGLKFLSIALIILGHTFSFGTQNIFFRNPGAAVQAPKNFLSQIFANGTLAVDTFYLISGLLVAYVSFKAMDHRDGTLPMKYFYCHRYVRLTPLLMIVVLISAYLLRYFGSGPYWLNSIMMYDEWCKKNSWVNALYLQNFIDTEHMCLSHSWYLATDMQFYLIAPLMIIPLYKNFKLGLFITFLFLLGTTMTTALITAINHYPAIPYINNLLPQSLVDEYYKNVYIKPYCRIGPYIVGILTGYLLWKEKEIMLKKLWVLVIWMSSVTAGLTVIYLMWPANQGHLPSDSEAAAYSALARSAWACTIAWIVIACNYGYGGVVDNILSWTPLVPLSRLTYSAYLIHPVVMNVYYGSIQTVVDFSFPYMIYLFLGNICITFILSIFLSVMFESPIIALEKVLRSRNAS